VPDIPAADAASIARGKALFTRQSCHSCHGPEGKGDGVQKMIDDEGFATRARDLTRGIYKGGHDTVSLYRRIRYGMPGTPMPASQNLKPEEVGDVIHYLLSLSTEEQRQALSSPGRSSLVTWFLCLPTDARLARRRWPMRLMPLRRDDAVPNVQSRRYDGGVSYFGWNGTTPSPTRMPAEGLRGRCAMELVAGPDEPFPEWGQPPRPSTCDVGR
jgi:cytochrome c551/c552